MIKSKPKRHADPIVQWPTGIGCPDCGTEMEKKAWLMIDVGDEGQGGVDVYQCPKCKNIEINS